MRIKPLSNKISSGERKDKPLKFGKTILQTNFKLNPYKVSRGRGIK